VKPTEEAAFVAFVSAQSPALLKAAWFISGDAHQAEELVQASLEKLYLAWHRDNCSWTRSWACSA
jgi:DNA-directed RNA polymerase specialized sigma24 family protein